MVNRRLLGVGHIMSHGDILFTILEEHVVGERQRGRPRLQFIDQIMIDVGYKSYEELKRKAERRE